jgi:ABC-type multidrug transport system ATPase subunit
LAICFSTRLSILLRREESSIVDNNVRGSKESLKTLSAGAKKQILNGVSIEVSPGEIVSLIGHNGSGKSTLLRSIFGIIPIWNGRVFVNDEEMATPSPQNMLRAGVSYILQGNRVFGDLAVYENLEVGASSAKGDNKRSFLVDGILSTCPTLVPHLRQRAASLSGGRKADVSVSGGSASIAKNSFIRRAITGPRASSRRPSLALYSAFVPRAWYLDADRRTKGACGT